MRFPFYFRHDRFTIVHEAMFRSFGRFRNARFPIKERMRKILEQIQPFEMDEAGWTVANRIFII